MLTIFAVRALIYLYFALGLRDGTNAKLGIERGELLDAILVPFCAAGPAMLRRCCGCVRVVARVWGARLGRCVRRRRRWCGAKR